MDLPNPLLKKIVHGWLSYRRTRSLLIALVTPLIPSSQFRRMMKPPHPDGKAISHVSPPTTAGPNNQKNKSTYLLQLLILQITPHHHFQYDEQLPVTDVPITIDIIYLERKPQFLLFVSFAAECAKAGDELLEVDITAAVLVEDGNHSGERGSERVDKRTCAEDEELRGEKSQSIGSIKD